ncbi:MAG TPA: S41 family peptidase [Acidobacteriota bacterium]|nr:S41 family peptidase [Acidobacteriota bacterium]
MTRRIFLLAAILLLVAPALIFAAGEARFMSYPDLSGDKIVFTYDDDLWLATVQGGIPSRITTHPGREYAAKFSPDGKWIAYTGSYDGPPDIYLIPSEGGIPKRLTYMPGGAVSVAWTPDSRYVVFRAVYGRKPISRDPKLYRVSIDGSMPEALPIERGVSCSFSEDGRQMLYVRRGNQDYYWKRYKGGQYPDIWLADFPSGKFTPITDYVGRNAYPMWIGDELYFNSDRGPGGITNIFAQNLKTKAVRQVTQFTDFDVMTPSTDRHRIVFAQNGYLYVLEPKSSSLRKITLNVSDDNWKTRERWVNGADYLQYMDVSNDGKQAVFTARGDVFCVVPGEEETTARNLTATSGIREKYAQISPDGKRVAFFSDRTGEYQLYLQDMDRGQATPLTDNLNRTVYHLLWSPDGNKILFGNKEFSIFWLDVASHKLTKIDESHYLDNDEFTWEMSDYAWSPDSRWIAYSFTRDNRNNVIFLYDTVEGKKIQLTNDFYDNLNPRWDADGGYLYFLSNRNFQIGMDLFEDDHIAVNPTRVMVVQLRKGEKPPFARPAVEGNERAKGEAKADTAAAESFRVDPEGIQNRVYAVPVEPGNYFHLIGGKGYAAWSSVPSFTEEEYEEFYNVRGRTKWNFHLFSMKDEKAVVLEDKIAEARPSVNSENLIIRKDSKVYTTTFEKAYQSRKLGKELNLSGMQYRVVPQDEWNQILSDTYRWYRDFFYDKDMHGRDWKAITERYRTYIKDLRSRDQLNWVLSEMVGELCVSHTYIGGGDTGIEPRRNPPVFTGLLGADLSADKASGLYRFERIYGPTQYFTEIETPLSRPDIDLNEGDYLLAINGEKVKVPDNYFRMLQVARDQYVTITVSSGPSETGARTYRVKPVQTDQQARYARWVSDNIDQVLKSSNGEVGYMHITAMGGPGVMQFDKYWRAFRYKEGLLIDVRGNSGGWTEYFLIDKLERRQVAYNVLQGMEPYRYPNPASRAHFVLISNEDNGSDGEAFVEHFKARKLGTVVGVPSWGGLVGILNQQQTIDNGTVEQSNNAFYGREGKWLVENHGADPDVLQDNDPASSMAGKDLQLEKALEVVTKRIKEEPFQFPPVPKYPKK